MNYPGYFHIKTGSKSQEFEPVSYNIKAFFTLANTWQAQRLQMDIHTQFLRQR